MPINDFKGFGVGPGDDATSQVDYLAATWRVEGWRSGILMHQQINKVLRQTSTMAAALAQTVVDLTQLDLLDGGDLTLVTNRIKSAFSASLPYNPGFTYPAGTIGYALQNSTGGGGSMTASEIRAVLTGQLTEAEFTSLLNGRLNLIDAPTTGLVTKVADLTTAYGSTTSAASSAAAAATSAINALGASNAAAVSAGAALTSETNASGSQVAATTAAGSAATSASNAATSATSASGSASSATNSASTASTASSSASAAAAAASTSASSANTSATSAGTFAAAADASRLTAQTQAANASTSATNAASSATAAGISAATASSSASLASTSESDAAASATAAASSATNAATSASTAGTQASLATTQALNAATQASNAASAALAASGSASSALSSSNAAGSSASAANASSVNAAASASQAQSALGQTARANMAYRLQAASSPAQAVDIAWGLSGWGFRFTGTGTELVASLNVAPLTPSVAYSVSFQAQVISGGSSQALNIEFFPDDLPQVSRTVTTTPQTFTWENASSASGSWNTALLQFFGTIPPGLVLEITDIKLEQNSVSTPFVLNPRDVTYYAAAAATSASAAAASASGANTAATASQNARLAAESAQAAASTSQSQAATSASTASSSSASATTQASNAATSASLAAGSASASNTSASNASTSAGSAAGSATAAASWYDATVAATGSLTASVSTLQTAVSGPAGLQAQYALKVLTTRSDGKQVFGYMGLQATAPNDLSGGQSEILFAADRLVFVPISSPNAAPVQPFVLGLVNGVTTLTVSQALIGDLTVGSAAIIELNANKIVGRTITADKIALSSGTVAVANNSGVTMAGLGGLGGGGSWSTIGAAAGQAGSYLVSGSPPSGKLLGAVTLDFDGQTIHAAVSGTLILAMGANWSGPGEGLHGIDAQFYLTLYKVISGNNLQLVAGGTAFANSRDITYLHPARERRIPFSMTRGVPGLAGTYVAFLEINVNATQGAGTSILSCFNPSSCFAPHNFHMFANGV